MNFFSSYPHAPLNHDSNLQRDKAKLNAEIAGLREMARKASGLREMARKVSQAKLATEHQIAMGALESENSALRKEIVQLRSRVADLKSELLAAIEKTRQNDIVPEKVIHLEEPQLTEAFVNSDETVKGDNSETVVPSQGSESPVSDDDGSAMVIGVQHVTFSYEDPMAPPMAFDAQNELRELSLRLQDRDRELSDLQKAVKKAEMDRASAEELTCNLKGMLLLQEHFKDEEEDISAKTLVVKLLDSLEAEKESCRRMEVENTKLRGQVRKCGGESS